MDLNTVTEVRLARDRSDLQALGPTVAPLAGGSALYGEPQHHLTAVVDLTTLGWPSLTITEAGTDAGADPAATTTTSTPATAPAAATDPHTPATPATPGLEIAATCTLAELSRFPAQPGWHAHHAFFDCCTALYGSFKVWNVATVGGNLCAALPAGPMTSLTAALDGEALVWRADGSDERMPVTAFITGNKTTVLNPGDVLRSITIPLDALHSRVAFRKIALSPLGRSGAVLLGRLSPAGAFVLTVTAGTVRPIQLRYETRPAAAKLRDDVLAITEWFTDAHGAADWRRAVSALLAEQILEELS